MRLKSYLDLLQSSRTRILGFGSNYMKLPSEIRVLTKLRQLVLYGNRLKSLPNGLRSLTKLEVLTVSQNSLREFPPSIAMGLVSLRELWMTHIVDFISHLR